MMKFLYIFLFALIIVCAPILHADDERKSLNELINQMKNIQADEFPGTVEDLRKSILKYIENKHRVCKGEFSTIILKNSGNSQGDPKKLSEKEMEQCFKKLKSHHKEYLDALFSARERYLKHVHDLRLKDLKAAHNRAVENLDSTFNKRPSKRKLIR